MAVACVGEEKQPIRAQIHVNKTESVYSQNELVSDGLSDSLTGGIIG